MTGVALEVIVAPGTHRVTWTISKPPDATTWEVAGEVELLGLRAPRASIFGRAPANWNNGPGTQRSAGWPQRFDYPLVYGQMNGGLDIVLIEPKLTVFGERPRAGGFMHFAGANAFFGSWAALIGRGAPETGPVLVDSGVIQVPHLEAFARTSPIRERSIPSDEFSVTLDPDSRLGWEDDGAEVIFEYQSSTGSWGWYGFSLAFSPVVRVKLAQPVPLSEFITQWAWPLRGLLAAATGRQEDITYLTCSLVVDGDPSPPNQRQFQVFHASITQEPYASSNSLKDKDISAVRLSEGESLLALLRRWQDLAAVQHPILNTYEITAVGRNQQPRTRFLLLVQALEGLYGYEYRAEIDERRAEHRGLRKPVLSRCKAALAELRDDFEFIKKFLPNRPFEPLDTALQVLLEILPVNLEPELAASALVQSVRAEDETATGTLSAIRVVRNKLSHGEKAYDRSQLTEVADILERAVRGHLLRLVGASDAAITRVLAAED
ncbi:hypothetical protein ACQ856_17330 [Mycolicibacterium psychrotolerans]|uniref:hypothetical protein n=1 Tax=Mycolicibacterium psychrotolerans TaxID=216929 RepID=UPI003D679879